MSVYPCVYREHFFTMCHIRAIPRFIPVYTGNTEFFQTFFCNQAVYPCVYREHPVLNCSMCKNPGLSLCIQGTRLPATRRTTE